MREFFENDNEKDNEKDSASDNTIDNASDNISDNANNNDAVNYRYAVEAVDYLLGEIEKALRNMLRLAKWAAGVNLSYSQREILQAEIDRLKKEIDITCGMLTGPPTLKN